MTPLNQQTNKLTDSQLDIIGKLTVKLNELNYEVEFVPPVSVGPIISVFRFLPQRQTRVSNLEGLATDFAVLLGVEDVFVKRLPGESSVGVFVPNATRQQVSFLDTVSNCWRARATKRIPLNFGVNYLGEPIIEDLTELPHLLVAGSTGSGKSTFINQLIASLIVCTEPSEVQFVLSDTKNVEFGHFIGAPHLLFEPAVTVYQTLEQWDWVIDEMNDRLKLLGKATVRNINEYHLLPTKPKLPFIIVIIDELADMMAHKGEKRGESKIAQEKIASIVQKSRASGIYFIAATQRPSVNVVAGSIKANFPARLTFRLPSETDSRCVIGTGGAEHLLSQGDMLYVSPSRAGLTRLHSPYARIEDIKAAVDSAMHKVKR